MLRDNTRANTNKFCSFVKKFLSVCFYMCVRVHQAQICTQIGVLELQRNVGRVKGPEPLLVIIGQRASTEQSSGFWSLNLFSGVGNNQNNRNDKGLNRPDQISENLGRKNNIGLESLSVILTRSRHFHYNIKQDDDDEESDLRKCSGSVKCWSASGKIANA